MPRKLGNRRWMARPPPADPPVADGAPWTLINVRVGQSVVEITVPAGGVRIVEVQ